MTPTPEWRARYGDRLDAWLAGADNDDLPHLQSFIQGIHRDHAAVLAGSTLSHSSATGQALVATVISP
ncbi:hypothetical protein AB0B56_39780 [Streptosporangium canum]|uniref:hypothetical protein n=1 Tax=Streptosporangium canum TaxID=324952 RepID=UPI0034348C89